MDTIHDIEQQLLALHFDTLEELLNEINEHFRVSVAIFDSNDLICGISAEMQRCKCYYMLLHRQPNQCSIFDPVFVNSVLSKELDTDMLCDYGCRLTLRSMDFAGSIYKIIMFQYNLLDDKLDFNPSNSPYYTPLYRNTDTSVISYFWKPSTVSLETRELFFRFLENSIHKLKCF